MATGRRAPSALVDIVNGTCEMNPWARLALLPLVFALAWIRFDKKGRVIDAPRPPGVVVNEALIYDRLFEDREASFSTHLEELRTGVRDAVLWHTEGENLVSEFLAESLVRWAMDYVRLWEKSAELYKPDIFRSRNWKELSEEPSTYEISLEWWDEELSEWRQAAVEAGASEGAVDQIAGDVDAALSAERAKYLGTPLP